MSAFTKEILTLKLAIECRINISVLTIDHISFIQRWVLCQASTLSNMGGAPNALNPPYIFFMVNRNPQTEDIENTFVSMLLVQQ